MKKFNKLLILIVLIVMLAIIYFIYNHKVPLSSIYIGSTFSQEDQDVFEQKLTDFSGKELTGYIDVIEKARMYQYLGYPGKAILTYKEFIQNSTGEYIAVLTNIGHLYKEICEVNDKLNRPYCHTAIDYYKKLIKKYNSFDRYKDISVVYMKLGKNKSAIENYNLYKKATGRSEKWIEKKLNIK